MKYLIVLLVLSSLVIVGCSENNVIGPLSAPSSETPSSLAKGRPCPTKVKYAGKTYNTVTIGSQCWLRENLDVGTMILGSQDASNNSTIEKYCYNDDPANCATYGGLYQSNEAMQYSTIEGTQGICPKGWHIPSFAEFQTLASTVNGDGDALKAVGQGTGTNTSGFSALLAGARFGYDPYFDALGGLTYYWSSTSTDLLSMYGLNSGILLASASGDYGFSVRCLKD